VGTLADDAPRQALDVIEVEAHEEPGGHDPRCGSRVVGLVRRFRGGAGLRGIRHSCVRGRARIHRLSVRTQRARARTTLMRSACSACFPPDGPAARCASTASRAAGFGGCRGRGHGSAEVVEAGPLAYAELDRPRRPSRSPRGCTASKHRRVRRARGPCDRGGFDTRSTTPPWRTSRLSLGHRRAGRTRGGPASHEPAVGSCSSSRRTRSDPAGVILLRAVAAPPRRRRCRHPQCRATHHRRGSRAVGRPHHGGSSTAARSGPLDPPTASFSKRALLRPRAR
jgi:hypothetical protein